MGTIQMGTIQTSLSRSLIHIGWRLLAIGTLCYTASVWSIAHANTTNLLKNGNAETSIDHSVWKSINGDWLRISILPFPIEGRYFFRPDLHESGQTYELYQDVELSEYNEQLNSEMPGRAGLSRQGFAFSAKIASYWNHHDPGSVIFEFRNKQACSSVTWFPLPVTEPKSKCVLGRYQSDEYIGTWKSIHHSALAPLGTTQIRVRLRVRKDSWSVFFTGTAFDDVRIRPMNPTLSVSRVKIAQPKSDEDTFSVAVMLAASDILKSRRLTIKLIDAQTNRELASTWGMVYARSGFSYVRPFTGLSGLGKRSFKIVIVDEEGQPASHAIVDTIIAASPNLQNTPPTADAYAFNVAKNDTLLHAKLHASDPNADPLEYEIVTLPIHGVLYDSDTKSPVAVNSQLQSGRFDYIPNADFRGRDHFQFRVSDGEFSSRTVEQVLRVSDFASETLHINGHRGRTDGRGVDLVILGDGYTSPQITNEYIPFIDHTIEMLFEDPFYEDGAVSNSAHAWNIHRIDVVSKGEGLPPKFRCVSDQGKCLHEADHNYQYEYCADSSCGWDSNAIAQPSALGISHDPDSASGISRILNHNPIPAYKHTFAMYPQQDSIYVVANTNYGRAWAVPGFWANSVESDTGQYNNRQRAKTVAHELGHSYALLADEYNEAGGGLPGRLSCTVLAKLNLPFDPSFDDLSIAPQLLDLPAFDLAPNVTTGLGEGIPLAPSRAHKFRWRTWNEALRNINRRFLSTRAFAAALGGGMFSDANRSHEACKYADWYWWHPTLESLMNEQSLLYYVRDDHGAGGSVDHADGLGNVTGLTPMYPVNLEQWLKTTYRIAGVIDTYSPRQKKLAKIFNGTANETVKTGSGKTIQFSVTPMLQAAEPASEQGVSACSGVVAGKTSTYFNTFNYLTELDQYPIPAVDVSEYYKRNCFQMVRWAIDGDYLSLVQNRRDISVVAERLQVVDERGNTKDYSIITVHNGQQTYSRKIAGNAFELKAHVQDTSGRIRNYGFTDVDAAVVWQVNVL